MRPYWEQDDVAIYHGDVCEVLPRLDVCGPVITDPPYNLGKQYASSKDSVPRDEYEAWMIRWMKLARAASGDAVVFSYSKRYLGSIDRLLAEAGLRQIRYLAWMRRDYAGDKWHGGPADCWEPIVWASSAEKPQYNKIFGALGRDCMTVSSVRNGRFRSQHPCPKPDRVAEWLVKLFAVEGRPVLDLFMGTGAFMEAAQLQGYPAIGIEIEERYCELAATRLSQRMLAL